MDMRLTGLFPMENGASRSKVIARIGAVDAIDGVLPQITLLRCVLHGLPAKVLEFELINVAWRLKEEVNGAGILADGKGFGLCEADVLGYQFQSEVRLGAGSLEFTLKLDDIFHVWRQKGRRPTDKFKYVLLEELTIHGRKFSRNSL